MSAWPEAVYIIKKLQKNFDFEQDIKIYTQNLNTLNGRVNTLNDSVAAVAAQIRTKNSTIRAVKKNGAPDTSESYEKGTVWLVVDTV